jgi:transposase
MTRLYGRGLKGERIYEYTPDVRFERTSVLSTIRLDGTQIPFIYNGTLNGLLFKEYVCKLLAPSLSKDDIVIMDNSSVHKAKGVLEEIEAKKVLPYCFYLHIPPI